MKRYSPIMSSIMIGYAPKVDALPAHQPENPLWSRNPRYIAWSAHRSRSALDFKTAPNAENDQYVTSSNSLVGGS
jgi:hypothetical protein